MKKLIAAAAAMLVLAACGGSDGDSGDSDTPTTATSEPADSGDSDAGAGVPDIAYPPGAEVEELAPGITQYTVANSTTDDAKAYWETYFEGIGFEKYNEASASVFYKKGSVKMQATYAQFDADVKGTVKVLSK
jgi:hypothetical protein